MKLISFFSLNCRVVAESVIVTGTICFIFNSDHWIDDLLEKVRDNYHVFMVEGYGMIILANSLIMVFDLLMFFYTVGYG